ncbi:MAG TPA: 2-phospho-L-lactate guanylyltransferase [Sphingopyxis sp.]|nr:2-phospho-L-lactate guanylyltransferase [Sphingopyxis sp.]
MNVLIPIKPSSEGKTRLSSVLNESQRADLIEAMFRHVLDVTVDVFGANHCYVVTRCDHFSRIAGLYSAQTVHDFGSCLNSALRYASRFINDKEPILVINADLPMLKKEDLHALIRALDHADVAIATDRHKTGTNSLLLKKPHLIDFSFGENSLQKHCHTAKNLNLKINILERIGLSNDLDSPKDLFSLMI